MVYEDRNEMDMAEEDRILEQDPYSGADFSDTFREQLNDDPLDEESLTEEEAATTESAPMPDEASSVTTDEFGERVVPSSTDTTTETPRNPMSNPLEDFDEE